MAEDHAACARGAGRGAVQRGRRDAEPAAAAPAGAAGGVPEVPQWLPGEEEAGLPTVLLRL